MSQTLKQRIQEDVKQAMRNKDASRLQALRLITAAIKQREVDERIDASDEQVLEVLGRMLKQRRDSVHQYSQAGRADLAAAEQFEIDLIEGYLPPALGEAELAALIEQAVAESGASSARDMGKVMAVLKPRIQGRADMTAVSAKVKARLV
ncbi:MAG: GatB/YqeY domain-containing protein [Gammaproteobacteria bacterium]|nr:GatB/YqeY domain-containing protein [Gammaproteobacteria bacterium]